MVTAVTAAAVVTEAAAAVVVRLDLMATVRTAATSMPLASAAAAVAAQVAHLLQRVPMRRQTTMVVQAAQDRAALEVERVALQTRPQVATERTVVAAAAEREPQPNLQALGPWLRSGRKPRTVRPQVHRAARAARVRAMRTVPMLSTTVAVAVALAKIMRLQGKVLRASSS